jgi:hypothetical protein
MSQLRILTSDPPPPAACREVMQASGLWTIVVFVVTVGL